MVRRLLAPAASLALVLFLVPTAPLAAQPAQPAQVVVPDQLAQLRLVWSVMMAVQHANETGNYSVLRDLGAPGFQQQNDQAALTATFSTLRASGIDLSATLLVEPVYEIAPAIQPDGLLRLRGAFRLRPTAIGFDMLFQPFNGRWRLFGVAVAPLG